MIRCSSLHHDVLISVSVSHIDVSVFINRESWHDFVERNDFVVLLREGVIYHLSENQGNIRCFIQEAM